MTVVHHQCEGFLKFVVPEDTVTIDMEVMTLKGNHIFQQDKHSNEKKTFTGGSRLSHTVVKPDSRLARIFVAKFLCIIKLIIITG